MLRRAVERGALLVSLALSACRSEPALPPGARELAARMVAGKFDAPGGGLEVHYQLFVPAGYSSARRYPLIVSLHGAGSHGTDNVRQLSSTVGAVIDHAQAVEPTLVLVPQDPTGDKWVSGSGEAPYRNFHQAERPQSAASGVVLAGIGQLEKQYSIDPDRIYLTGGSAGGTGTWDWITRGGVGRFAAAVPVTGANDPASAATIAHLPIWAFHGAQDNVAPVENSREMVAALRALGSPVRYTEYPDVGHESWNRAYAESELFRWLLAQRRSAAAR
ncbi:MAG TPA: dienelactone hydrolase family protein [Polyangiaceae bacterium]|nr:dienelactone hydrolase family protein [Polyangiaceae bacterium]